MFGERLKKLREKNGISQAELARKLGLSQGAVGNWESGKREPNFETSRRIADYFCVSVDFLLGRENSDTDLSFDDFTYAMQNEARSLTEKDRSLLLSMARQLSEARKASEGSDSSH